MTVANVFFSRNQIWARRGLEYIEEIERKKLVHSLMAPYNLSLLLGEQNLTRQRIETLEKLKFKSLITLFDTERKRIEMEAAIKALKYFASCISG